VRRSRTTHERVARARAGDLVSFSILCTPISGVTLEQLRARLSLKTIREFLPDETTRRNVMNRLWSLGFEVFPSSGPIVSARGPAALFGDVFNVQLVKRVRKTPRPDSRRVLVQTSIETLNNKPIRVPETVPQTLMVGLAQQPELATPSLPPEETGRHLHLPGDIAQLTRASAAHRKVLTTGDRATGSGVIVAIVDAGFPKHPFLDEHGYRVTRIAAADATDPEIALSGHGVGMLAGLFACAPDVTALGVKWGDNPIAALDAVMDYGGVQVASLSWGFDQGRRHSLPTSPDTLLMIEARILEMIASGVTVVAAAGNGERFFPAMMPDVIAVGGVTVNADDELLAWKGASSFTSLIYSGRRVPDVCGIATRAQLPTRAGSASPGWVSADGATSLATAQVAGVAALLLQKKPTLRPNEVREHLMHWATDVEDGKTATKNVATTGDDLATGAGLVNALAAWENLT
jgi:hypothetical protein